MKFQKGHQVNKGRIPWNKGEPERKKCVGCGKEWVAETRKDKIRMYCCRKCFNSNYDYVSWNKGKRGEEAKGSWKGGRGKTWSGHILIYKPEHPYATKTGYIREHRFVMEKLIGRYLTRREEVHHLDGDPKNNNINNLRLYSTKGEHTKYHRPWLHRKKNETVSPKP